MRPSASPLRAGPDCSRHMVGALTSEMPAFMPALAVTMIDLIAGDGVRDESSWLIAVDCGDCPHNEKSRMTCIKRLVFLDVVRLLAFIVYFV